jgi:hypothetical protein
MTKGNVKRDLALGEVGEKRVIKLFNEAGIDSKKQPSKGRFSDYDVISLFELLTFTTEVKYDIYALRSGNIAIEVFNPKIGQPSGLMATKADLWAHVTDEVHLANVEGLKLWVENNSPKRVITAGGDDNATLYLYPLDSILQEPLFQRIDHLTDDERRNIIIGQLDHDRD